MGGALVTPLEGEKQCRYYRGEGIADLEAAALARPEDVQVWLRLAKRIVGDDRWVVRTAPSCGSLIL